ncbi:MAG: SUMF1/EgtB/PvdO family nonheme iron enzyme, partial [bacterium]
EQRRERFGKDTEPLVTSPLLVRMLLVVHFSERQLPEQRAELYMKATDAMLLPEYAPDEEIANRIGRLVGGSREVHRDLVQHLAFAIHSRGEKLGREISEGDLRAVLRQNPVYATAVDDFIALTRLRGTLLEERLGFYRFIHLAFQEYLAARYLAEIKRGESGVEGIAAFLESGPILESWWREPALLVAGYLSVTSPQTAQLYLQRLAGTNEPAEKRQLTPEVQMAAAELAATACLEVPASPESLRKQLAERLVALFRQSDLMVRVRPILRAAAGETMARLGDPRPEVTTIDAMQFCLVPVGPFWMGSDKSDKEACDDEKPLHRYDKLDYDFWMAQYSVTVAQFCTFVEASKHKPEDADSLHDLPNRPVVKVTWYEAVKFCEWLTKKWQRESKLSQNWAVHLPSEAEWKKAARGGLQIPIQPIIKSSDALPHGINMSLRDNPEPTRRYPWGNEPDPNRANYDDTGIGTTSTVGCFSNGESPYGVQELSSNVWKWTRSLWEEKSDKHNFKYPYDPADGREKLVASHNVTRVLRGGAFNSIVRNVRCVCRFGESPEGWSRDIGFRVVLRPLL